MSILKINITSGVDPASCVNNNIYVTCKRGESSEAVRRITAIFILSKVWKWDLKQVLGVKQISLGREWVINKRNIQIWMVQNPTGMAIININKPNAHESLLPHLSPLQHARTGTRRERSPLSWWLLWIASVC